MNIMNMLSTFVGTSLLLFFCSVFSLTAANPAIDEALILTGVKEEITQSTPELLSHFNPMRQDLRPAFAKAYDSLAGEIFKLEDIYASAVSYWTVDYDSSRAGRVLKWLRSPTGKAVANWQKQAFAPSATRDIVSHIKKLEGNKKLQKRVEGFTTSIDNYAHSRAEVVMVLSRQLIQIANALQPTDQILTTAQIGTMVEQMRPHILDYYRGLNRGFYAYALRSASEKQIGEYAAFLASEDGRWFEHQRNYAIAQAYHMAGARFVLSLKDAFDAIVEQPEDSTTAAYINSLLRERSENNRVLGVIEATVDAKEWVGYVNAEPNKDSTVTILALNTDRSPQEQLEITFPFKGVGTYPVQQHKGVFFRIDKNRNPLEVYYSDGKPGNNIVVTGYDELQDAIEGTINVVFVGESGSVEFSSRPFIVRIKR